MSVRSSGARLATLLVVLGLVAGGKTSRGQEAEVAEQADGQPTQTIQVVQVQAVAGGASEYWLGVAVQPLPDVLRAQLKLDQGVVVERVTEDSPAAQAGIQPHDILLQFGEVQLADPAALVKAVEEAKEAETELVLLRGGERQTLRITPAKRPASARATHEQHAHTALQNWVAQGPGNIFVWRFNPGMALPQLVQPGQSGLANLPQGTSITITKEDSAPAQIEVKQGDKSWTVTAETVGELPAELQAPIRQLLDRPRGVQYITPQPPVVTAPPHLPGQFRPGPPAVQHQQRLYVARSADELAKKLDEVMAKVEQLQKSVDQLKDKDR